MDKRIDVDCGNLAREVYEALEGLKCREDGYSLRLGRRRSVHLGCRRRSRSDLSDQ